MREVMDYECQTALDCIKPHTLNPSFDVFKVCYHIAQNGDYLRKQNSSLNAQELGSYCDCSSWYGFVGVNCDEPSVQTRYLQGSLILFMVHSILLISISCYEVTRVIPLFMSRDLLPKKSQNAIKLAFRLIGLNILGLVGVMLYSALNLVSMFNATKFEVVTHLEVVFKTAPDVIAKYGTLAIIMLIFANEIFMVVSMQISLSWIEIAAEMSDLFDAQYHDYIIGFRNVIYVLTFASLILVISFLCAKMFLASTFCIMLLGLVLLTAFFFGRRAFRKIIDRFDTNLNHGGSHDGKKTLQRSMKLVNSSSRLHVILLALMIISLIIYYAMFPKFYNLVEVGHFNFVLFTRDLSVVFGLYLISANTYYARNLCTRIKKRMNANQSSWSTPRTSKLSPSPITLSPKQNLGVLTKIHSSGNLLDISL